MMYLTTIDIEGITPEEYRSVLDKMGVETHPDAHIYFTSVHRLKAGSA